MGRLTPSFRGGELRRPVEPGAFGAILRPPAVSLFPRLGR